MLDREWAECGRGEIEFGTWQHGYCYYMDVLSHAAVLYEYCTGQASGEAKHMKTMHVRETSSFLVFCTAATALFFSSLLS